MLERIETDNLQLLLEVGFIDETEYMHQLTERALEKEEEDAEQ